MGMTGVGKSSFIQLFTEEGVPVGTSLDSCMLFLWRRGAVLTRKQVLNSAASTGAIFQATHECFGL